MASKFPVETYDDRLKKCKTLNARQDDSFRDIHQKVKSVIAMLRQSNELVDREDSITTKYQVLNLT